MSRRRFAPSRRPGGPAPPGASVLLAAGLRLAGIGLLAIAVLVGWLPLARPGVQAAAPRVVVIVGPVGDLTDHYRADGRAAAAAARRYTDDVVTVFSPNATWSAVRRALAGASLVVYLGHGNGWPSRYSRTLNPRTQNGLGLNPVAGVDDVAHQYFGEWHLARKVRLAPGALVVLSHLCYASGNSEPGLPEGTLDVARQRVDNFAAGWIAAGAGAVLVDAYQAPAHYVKAALSRPRPIEQIWQAAPSFHDHVLSFSSERTPGAVAYMDPERRSSGFTRSLVVARGAGGDPVPPRAGPDLQVAAGNWELVVPPDPAPPPDAFTLGARPRAPTLAGLPLAGSAVELALPVEVPPDVTLGATYRLGMRWIPLDAGGIPAPASSAPDAEAVAGASDLVAPEAAAALVEVVPAKVEGSSVRAAARLPPASGRYRLQVTVHDGDGIALPYDVQASVPAVVVHVGGPGAAWIDAPADLALHAGTSARVGLVVVNGEADPWGPCREPPERLRPEAVRDCGPVRLVGRWLALDQGDGPLPTIDPTTMSIPLEVPPASAHTAWLTGTVPEDPGTYVLVTSVERHPADGPIRVLGRPSTTVVEVVAALLLPASGG